MLAAGPLALASAAPARRRSSTPRTSSSSGEWVPIHLGPLDLSINKAVAYLILGTICTMVLGIMLMRVRVGPKNEVGRRQAVGEIVYDIAQTQVAEQGLPHKAIGRWFPYVASLMLFIWVINMLGFIPLPLSDETLHGPGGPGAADARGLRGHVVDHRHARARADDVRCSRTIEGIRYNGPVKYFKSWIPDVPKALYPLIVPLEILGQFMRLISLASVSTRTCSPATC